MTNAHNLTARQIVALQVEAARAGDFAMAAICVRANGGTDAAGRYPALSKVDAARAGFMSIDIARAECAEVIAAAEAMSA